MNPQFTCRTCPFAVDTDVHQAIDDLGQPFYIVDAVECAYDGSLRTLPSVWRRLPSLLEGVRESAPPRVEPCVACPLLTSPERFAPLMQEIDGVRWVPVGHCRTCQFYRGIEGERTACSPDADAGLGVVCAAPGGAMKGALSDE